MELVTIPRSEYFIAAMQSGAFKWKRWIIEAFALTDLPSAKGVLKQASKGLTEVPEERNYELALYKDDNGYFFYSTDPELENQRVYLQDADPKLPVFQFMDELIITSADAPNLNSTAPIKTTYGNLLFNWIALIYPFAATIDYINVKVDLKAIEKIIEDKLTDNPPANTERVAGKIYVDQYLKFNKAVLSLAGLTQLCVPSASPRTLTTDPKVYVRRAELLEQYKNELDDPAIIALIDSELIKIDKEWIANDPDGSMGFFIKGKSFNVIRKKQFLMHGAEAAFTDGTTVKLIPTSLVEGWDIRMLPEMANSLREGSYSRGTLTALGGAAVKETYRVGQNTRIVAEDCGSKLGLPTLMNQARVGKYVGNYVLEGDKSILLTTENLPNYLNKLINVRSPVYCHTPGSNFCKFCAGEKLAESPEAIGTFLADVGSTFMGRFMAAMHGKVLATSEYKPAMAIS